ncbi:MFS transporter [soil metagenome]
MAVNLTTTNAGNWVLTATILASSMASIDASALNVALPVIQQSLKANATQLVWVVNAYALMLASLILMGGALGDQLGRKKIMMTGIALFVVASAACGAAPSIEWLIATRILQGMGGALMIPGSLAIISALFEGKKRGKAIGTWSAAGAFTGVAGPLLGGLLADAGLWRYIFLLNLPLGLASFAIIYIKVPETRDESDTGAIDYRGSLLSSLGLAGLTYSFTMWSSLGPTNPAVYGSLVGGLASLGAFVWVETHQKAPLVPLHLFNSRTFTGTNLLTLLLYGALSTASFFLTLNLVQIQGYRPALAGMAFIALPLPLILFSRWAGGFSDRHGPRLPLIIGPVIVGFAFLWLSFIGLTPGPSHYWFTFLPGLLLFGIGLIFTVVPLTNAVMSSVSTHYAGTASGINNAVSRTAGVLFLAIAGSIAIVSFRYELIELIKPLHLTPSVISALRAEADQLGGISVPEGVTFTHRIELQKTIKLAFLHTFQLVMWGCTGLAWLSALMATVWVETRQKVLV